MNGKVFAAFISALFVMTAITGTASAYTESATDLWNYENISNMDLYLDDMYVYSPDSSDQHFNMFGMANYGGDGTATRFWDFQPDGSLWSVRLTLGSAVTIKSFELYAAHDSFDGQIYRDSTYRGFKQFSLYSSTDGTNWGSALYTYNATNPYNPPLGGTDYNVLDLISNIDPTTSQFWRMDFVQNGSTDWCSGPRIKELDGFSTTAVPEPISTALFILGGATLAARRLRKK